MTVTWEQALAECEARLDAAATAIDRGAIPVLEAFAAPQIDDPMPAAFEDRARACSDRGNELTDRLGAELDRIRVELRRLPRMPRAPREVHFDAQA